MQDLLTLARRGVSISEVVNLNNTISEYLVSPEFEKSATTSSWGYEDGPWKGPGPPLLGAADCLSSIDESSNTS